MNDIYGIERYVAPLGLETFFRTSMTGLRPALDYVALSGLGYAAPLGLKNVMQCLDRAAPCPCIRRPFGAYYMMHASRAFFMNEIARSASTKKPQRGVINKGRAKPCQTIFRMNQSPERAT